MTFFEGNYVVYYVELKCKYSSLEHRKRNAGCLSLVKVMETEPGGREEALSHFGRRKHEQNCTIKLCYSIHSVFERKRQNSDMTNILCGVEVH